MTISQTALDVRARARQGLIGMPAVTGHLLSKITMINEDPQAVQSDTVTFSGFTGPTKTITINGIDVTFVAETSTTVTAANCAAAVNLEPGVRGQVSATSAAAVVTLTGLTPGLAYTLTETDGEIALASVAVAASAAAIPFGRLVIDDGQHPDLDPTRLGRLAQVSAFTAQTATLTVTFAVASHYTVTIVDKATGVIIAQVGVPADTNDNTTAANIDAALNAVLPANTVLSSVATNVVTLTAEVAGFEFEVTAAEAGAGAGDIVLAATNGPDTGTSLTRVAAGVSQHSIMDEAATIGAEEGEYPANHGFIAFNQGPVFVERPGVVSKGDPVFVELAVGDDAGKFFSATGATRVRLGALTWDRDGRTAADGVAVLRVDLAA
jgi:hypothetical protein